MAWAAERSYDLNRMLFEALFVLGAAALLCGLIALIYCYLSRRAGSPPEQPPSFALYIGVALLVAMSAYVMGTAVGIYFGCLPTDSGNLCGIYGALGVGPLASGMSLTLYALSWKRMRSPQA